MLWSHFYGIARVQAGECKSGRLEEGEEEAAGTADCCAWSCLIQAMLALQGGFNECRGGSLEGLVIGNEEVF